MIAGVSPQSCRRAGVAVVCGMWGRNEKKHVQSTNMTSPCASYYFLIRDELKSLQFIAAVFLFLCCHFSQSCCFYTPFSNLSFLGYIYIYQPADVVERSVRTGPCGLTSVWRWMGAVPLRILKANSIAITSLIEFGLQQEASSARLFYVIPHCWEVFL